MSLHRTIKNEVERIKSVLDIRDSNAISTMEALEWVLSLIGDEKDLYIPTLEDLVPVIKSEYSNDIETLYDVGLWSFSDASDADLSEIEHGIVANQSWRKFLLTQHEPPAIPMEDGEDA
jgi:hypothetical protein